MTASPEARETALLAAQAAADKLATDVSIVDVSDRLAITDAFVLASAPNERQVQAIVDEVEERLRQHGVKPVRREGVAEARWVLLDFVDVVVHVQHAEERAYYALERLWKDCPTIPFADRAAPPDGQTTTGTGRGTSTGTSTGTSGDTDTGTVAGTEAPLPASRETLSADDVDPMSADPTPLPPEPAGDDTGAGDSSPEATGR
ncbi:ribosome silencing factor [Geodermatophilus sp. SYSU D00703]